MMTAEVQAVSGRGWTAEELAERCADKVISISDTADPVLQQQAHAFRKELVKTLTFYLNEAVRCDRTTVYNALNDAGQPELAELIRRL